jgi:hypothetical protein
MKHPKLNDKGQSVEITIPSSPTSLETWDDSTQIATATPVSELPARICNIPVRSWTDAPTDNSGWENLSESMNFEEPPFQIKAGKKAASGGVVVEPDGRIWVVSPTNKFGGYENTFPKGKIEAGQKISMKANALKEVYEEAGLQVELTGFLCDSERDTSTTRLYLAKRLSGNPADMGWESQAVHLIPKASLANILSHTNDKPVIEALMSINLALTKSDIVKYQWGLTSGHRILATISGYRLRFANWPTKVLMDEGMANAIRDEVLTPLGWELLSQKIELIPCDVQTVFAEGPEGTFEYGDHTHRTDKLRPDIWIWGVEIAGY